ncbi:hypothetical protein FKR81_10605 [Lentzea tibetensis]|uniref:SGNH hydrolase-type esterase domain-containing protein n=1 Tax=Lentzea tibetensis TaxID=2591470 RepID=A0A563EWT7_9PSEU|nr:GDSL-type esterase/lipase family protein [Lentzea tibetensis]TWP52032.1 hypothetical protein FKR81_10605 [Lentzea tibetensis]
MRRVLTVLVGVPLLAILLIVSDHPFPPPAGPGGSADTVLVGLGDSTMSGEGAGDYEPGTNGENNNWCHRSRNASVLKTAADTDRAVNLACSGANSEKLRADQIPALRQLAARSRVTTIVVAIGANDDPRFSEVLNKCVEAWVRRADCATAWAREWQTRVQRMVPKVQNALNTVRQTMRDAGYLDSSYTLVVQSYAAPVGPGLPARLQNLSGCPLRSNDVKWVRDNAVYDLSLGLRTAAEKTHARFLDLARAGEQHEACVGGSDASSEWFNRLAVDWDGIRDDNRKSHVLQESFHPNARGHAEIGRCLTEFLATSSAAASCVPRQDGTLGLSTE